MFQSRCKILSRGFEPFGSFNLAGVGSLPAWQQAEPVIQTGHCRQIRQA